MSLSQNVPLSVNGTLMRGLELNPNMVAVGATFVREDTAVPWPAKADSEVPRRVFHALAASSPAISSARPRPRFESSKPPARRAPGHSPSPKGMGSSASTYYVILWITFFVQAKFLQVVCG